ncbi:copper transporter [Nocardioides euryhalodurans]|uniref:copper transporter n=1 Tax=Nocardioides euryhalodurans TaxID=2518370 RepID=UPI001421EE7D|nr:copper transporter [Nocardioides euryhalodurans]
MTLVRRHLVAAVSLVLALATGIALGAGPLSRETLVPTRAETPATPVAPAEDEVADDLATSVAPTLTRERLSGRTVAVLATPGADQEAVDALVVGVEQAGGTVARWEIGTSLVAAGETALVDTLGEQLLEQLGSEVADAEAPPYERMGQLLGVAVATSGRSEVAGKDETTVRQSIDAAELLTSTSEEPRLAPLVLVVLGNDTEDAIVAGLTTGLADRARDVVVAAPERSGDLAVVEELGLASTVDGVDGAAGQLAAVLALGVAEDTEPGAYGASGADGVLPLR